MQIFLLSNKNANTNYTIYIPICFVRTINTTLLLYLRSDLAYKMYNNFVNNVYIIISFNLKYSINNL